ncbi:PREDICTED: uncharacterized protein LOC109590374 [Amphimedon queenslandica]|uniref:Uncharacterized protein n=1 Tax=Amphimedon queenslandica TaxID=400682 RepID=A0A1X7T1G9_AMPQE|nr:PREDICTED: uncharacterized protein LOC109590374 [Amphimedon queenslandica]|eukprot:XP_019861858.1 PREDICTED: uncharacterized protein LOC109590374 [Amphimedon queenslandica]
MTSTSIWSAYTPTIAHTVTVAVVSSTYTVTKMTNLETTNKTLIIATSAAGGVCLIVLLIVIFFCLYLIIKKKKQMSIAQIQAEPQYCEVLELEEKVKVSECQAYGKLDKERVKVSECQAYGKLDQLRITRDTS